MTAIQPVENDLNALIKREEYRQILARISNSYEEMQTYMDNLEQDINAIDEYVDTLDRNAAQGFDVGTSKQTLLFQRSTLQIDLNFYEDMKKTYVRKIYEDLWQYTDGIITSAIEIEANPLQHTVEQLKGAKLSGCRVFEEGTDYTMSEIYTLLSTTERNLYELSSDIASFSDLVTDAERKQQRGFSIGNMLMNLQSQRSKLTLEFQGYVQRLEQFLIQNEKFSNRCLKRVKMISTEIVSEKEMQEQQEAQSAETPADSGDATSPTE